MDAANVALAQRNLHTFGQRCTVIQAAIWSHDGEIAYGGTDAWALQVAAITGQDTLIDQKAPALTVPTLLDRFGLDRVDFMKIDIEGAEAEILQLGTQWLAQVDTLNLEVHPPATLEGCEAILQASGFAVTRNARFGKYLSAIRSNYQESPI
jgi:FkbM family methyltransferase